ncbi:MAG: hypothetical protein LBC92_00340 [Rickettsiales bacterium]|jgi:hypothetical protein|nr:hypothetical protein [Rickettsiales bacterium]
MLTTAAVLGGIGAATSLYGMLSDKSGDYMRQASNLMTQQYQAQEAYIKKEGLYADKERNTLISEIRNNMNYNGERNNLGFLDNITDASGYSKEAATETYNAKERKEEQKIDFLKEYVAQSYTSHDLWRWDNTRSQNDVESAQNYLDGNSSEVRGYGAMLLANAGY